jgi:apolipoprotein N-acyltransferase
VNVLARWGEGLRTLTGWRRMGAAALAGAVAALAFAPFNFFPALLLGFAVLALLLENPGPHPVRRAALTGWAFGFGQFLIGLHWIAYPFMVDPAAHLWQLPFAVSLLPMGLGLFAALGCAVAALFSATGTARLIVLAICYAISEWIRGHVLTGFPWNLPAHGWGASLAILQSVALFGSYGLSFLTILLGVSLADLTRRRVIFPGAMLLLFLALWAYGAVRLQGAVADVPGVHLRLVQPNIPQAEKDDPRFFRRNLDRLLALSVTRPQGAAPSIIIWPEAATGFPLARSPIALHAIAILTGNSRLLLAGSVRYQPAGGSFIGYNSLYVFGADGETRNVYDKFHLVPFGEYVPFGDLLRHLGITKLTAGQLGFGLGDGIHRYALPGAPLMTPLICYEAIFPGAVTSGRPGWFVNVTDDSWFGPWAGPRQHFLIARLRAIEEGVPMARDADTGISAVIDPLGRIKAQLALNQQGVLDIGLPQALAPTLYALFGDWVFGFLLLAAGFGAFVTQRRVTL